MYCLKDKRNHFKPTITLPQLLQENNFNVDWNKISLYISIKIEKRPLAKKKSMRTKWTMNADQLLKIDASEENGLRLLHLEKNMVHKGSSIKAFESFNMCFLYPIQIINQIVNCFQGINYSLMLFSILSSLFYLQKKQSCNVHLL